MALIVGEGGATTQRLSTHLASRGIAVKSAGDCGAALELLGDPQAVARSDTRRAIVLDVARAGLGARAFREMLQNDYPGVSLLALPPDDAGPEDVGLLAAAVVQSIRGASDEGSVPAEDAEERFETPLHGYKFEDLESLSPRMIELFNLIPRVAVTDSPVLVLGETGVGKELVAAAIHRQSRRRSGEFFTINCGALTETLLESELFGHERGAFTGAVQTKKGYFELASGGTLFLDELGTISQQMQVKLLRVLERMEVRRVGGSKQHQVDVRDRRRHERPARGCCRLRQLPRGPVLPLERRLAQDPGPARASRGRAAAGRGLPEEVQCGPRAQRGDGIRARRPGATRTPRLARQRARAGERHRSAR